MDVLCLDLEGVLIPEVWQAVAKRTGIDGLMRTTRDIPDYDELMRYRLDILDREDVSLSLIQQVIETLDPLPGAVEFLSWARTRYQVAILSDTFYEFGMPFMAKLSHPLLLCHKLDVRDNRITGYALRQPDPKRAAVRAFHSLRYRVIAGGDSFNDVSMLDEADAGIFFRVPDNVREQFPQYPVAHDYDAFAQLIDAA